MGSDFPVTMMDVLPLLGISYPPGKRSFYIKCPCCDDNKKHLNINLEKNAFRCPKCGFDGGVLDLYAFYAGTNTKEAFAQIRRKLDLSAACQIERRRSLKPVVNIESPITDVDTRHETYSALLSLLSLSTDHRENLTKRGLSEQIIEQKQYRTIPMIGFESIARNLLERGCYLEGVPGFYKNQSERWCLRREKRGILLPVRDREGRIQSLHIRLDDDSDGKFRWLSSIGLKKGCSPGSCVHLAGVPSDNIILTEGVLKADIVNHLTGRAVVSVQGVSALSELGEFLDLLWIDGVRKVYTAYDMDYLVNPHVQRNLMSLYALLQEHNFSFSTYVWNPAYKGVDDYTLAQVNVK